MARLIALPEKAIIDGYKGLIDFYIHRGTPCARSWPRSPSEKRSPAVQAQWLPFSWAAKNWDTLSPEVQAAYIASAADTDLTGRDLFVKAFITSYFREGL